MDIRITDHVIDRYRQRVAPALSRGEVLRRLQEHVQHGKLDGDVYASAKRVLLPDCVLVVRARDREGYRFTAITCYAREALDIAITRTQPLDEVSELLLCADRRVREPIPGTLAGEAETMPLDDLRAYQRRLVTLTTAEKAHRAECDLWIKNPAYFAKLDEGEVLLIRAASVASGHRIEVLNTVLADVNRVLKRRDHIEVERGNDLCGAVVRAAILVRHGRASADDLDAAIDALCDASPRWADFRRSLAGAATGPG